MGVDAVNRQHTGPGVENLEQVRGVVVDRFFCGGEVAHHFVDPVVDSGPAKHALIVPFDLWMEQFGRDPVGVLGPEPGPVEASRARRTISTCSCDLAYPHSPTASRAPGLVGKTRYRTTLPSRTVVACLTCCKQRRAGQRARRRFLKSTKTRGGPTPWDAPYRHRRRFSTRSTTHELARAAASRLGFGGDGIPSAGHAVTATVLIVRALARGARQRISPSRRP
jgi:hypothetical protein